VLTPDDQFALAMGLCRCDETIKLTGVQLRQLQGPYVYELTRQIEDDRWTTLYIGVKSAQGERPFNPEHHAIGKSSAVQPTDVLYIYPMPTANVANWAEKVFLARTETAWNQQRRYSDTWRQFPPECDPASVWLGEPTDERNEGLEMALLS